MNNIIRFLSLAIYPLILLITFVFIFRKPIYKKTVADNWKSILINSLAFVLILTIGLVIYFHFEDTIYVYDYAGHWTRALTLKKYFWEEPSRIFSEVYRSMNQDDYSYLPALFGLLFILLNESYGFFCLSNLVLFLFPTILLLNILYFTYINKSKYVPILVSVVVFPLYLTLFFGKVDCCGLLFIAVAYSLIILPKFEDIRMSDNLFVNLCAFLAIFLRRWYLYSVICLYLSYFIKWLFTERKFKDFFRIITSGLVMLVVILLFFRPFLLNTISNNFSEAYEVYNNPGKLLSFVNNISPLILLVCLLGCISLLRKNKELLLINILSIVLPCALIWRIQSFEYHHYYIFLLNIIILFVSGLEFIAEFRKRAAIVFSLILLFQPVFIFSNVGNTLPLYTNIRKTPEILTNKKDLIELSSYLRSIESDDTMTAYLCGGSYGIISDDLIRNAILPDLDGPSIDSAIFDLRDGFPKNLEYIRYILVIDPMIYTSRDYQHMFDIISYAVTQHPEISRIYNPIYETNIGDYKVTIYEKTGEMTPEMKQYFYEEMLKYYPDKADYFSYILD